MARKVKIATLAPRPLLLAGGEINRASVDRMIEFWGERVGSVLPDKPDLILVPEASDRYGDLAPDQRDSYYRERKGLVKDFWTGIAVENSCHVAYSAARMTEQGTFRNSTQIIGPSGKVLGIYDKNHPTINEMGRGVVPGEEAGLIECGFGKVACAICFDLNFTRLREQYAAAKPDLILFSSMYHGGLMQSYWAYSCRAHFAAAVPGQPSAIISPVGTTIASTTNYYDFAAASVNLDCGVFHIDYNGAKFADIKNKYGAGVRIFDPGHLGSVLISCESEELNIRRIKDEFGLEPLDDYFARATSAKAAVLGQGG